MQEIVYNICGSSQDFFFPQEENVYIQRSMNGRHWLKKSWFILDFSPYQGQLFQ